MEHSVASQAHTQIRRYRTIRALTALLFAVALVCPSLKANVVSSKDYILWYRNYDSPAIRALVELSLRKTPEYGDFRVLRSEELSQGRVLRELSSNRSGLVDIANVATSAQREEFLTPIPIPIDGGLLGFRVCLVMPDKLDMFKGIHNLQDLVNSDIRIGQGSHWPDTSVLQANGIKVITHTRFEILFGMLKKNRFECFARGVSEVLYDMENQHDADLVIEPNLLLAYPMPSYLFVAPGDHETAHRLQLGMERAISDGSFAVFLKKYYGRAVEMLNLHRRSVVVLDNPYLTEESWHVGRRTLENLQRRLDILTR